MDQPASLRMEAETLTMKVVHVNYRDLGGGAAVAASQIHKGLCSQGIDSKMLVIHKYGDDPNTHTIKDGLPKARWWIGKKLSKIAEHLQHDTTGAFHSANYFGSNLLQQIKELEPDIVHLHWIGCESLSIKQVAEINQPIVWTMHDMWPFCGAENLALPWRGERYINGYSRYNRNASSRGPDINRATWARKARYWKGKGFHAVAHSKWMQACVDQSKLAQIGAFHPSELIYLGIDQTLFYPDSKATNRKRLGLKADERVLLFGAHMTQIPTKGFTYLAEALSKITPKQPTTLLNFGQGTLPRLPNFRSISLGEVKDPELLRQAYSSSDLFLMPSMIESFGLVAAESMACGTPVVCFDTTGLRDVVGHRTEGYRAKQFDSDDFARGIDWCLESSERLQSLGMNGLAKVKNNFSLSQMCTNYRRVYEKAHGCNRSHVLKSPLVPCSRK